MEHVSFRRTCFGWFILALSLKINPQIKDPNSPIFSFFQIYTFVPFKLTPSLNTWFSWRTLPKLSKTDPLNRHASPPLPLGFCKQLPLLVFHVIVPLVTTHPCQDTFYCSGKIKMHFTFLIQLLPCHQSYSMQVFAWTP